MVSSPSPAWFWPWPSPWASSAWPPWPCAASARRDAAGCKPAADRRLQVVESLILDPPRRLVLVRLDREERLLLLGEGRMLAPGARPAQPARKAADPLRQPDPQACDPPPARRPRRA